MNWGTGIAIAYGTFAIAMTSAVLASRKHDPGLLQKNYYELDLNYQARLDRKQNAAALAELPQLRYDVPSASVRIAFPQGMAVAGGKAKFYRSAVTHDDFSVSLEQQSSVVVPAGQLAPGRWHVELDWEADGKPYFVESAVFIAR
jgi:nitrogen fixation protein FixH